MCGLAGTLIFDVKSASFWIPQLRFDACALPLPAWGNRLLGEVSQESAAISQKTMLELRRVTVETLCELEKDEAIRLLWSQE
jgi:hypothetical protein